MTVEKPWKLAKPRLAFIIQPNIRLVHCLGRGSLITPNIWGMSREKWPQGSGPEEGLLAGSCAGPEVEITEGDSEFEADLLSFMYETLSVALAQPSHPHQTILHLLRLRLRRHLGK